MRLDIDDKTKDQLKRLIEDVYIQGSIDGFGKDVNYWNGVYSDAIFLVLEGKAFDDELLDSIS